MRAHIESHCDEEGECLLCRFRALRVAREDGAGDTAMEVRRAYWLTSKPLAKGDCVTATCGQVNCIAHLVAISKSALVRKRRAPVSLIARMKIAANKPRKFSDEVVEEVRTSSEPVAVLAKRFGMSKRYAHMLRRGECRVMKEAGVWAGLMGPAC